MVHRVAAGPAAALVLAACALATIVRPLVGEAPAPPCAAWVAVRDGRGARHDLCGVEALEPVLARCPLADDVHPGDLLTVVPDGLGCTTRTSPLPARARLRLGLRLDPNREGARALTAVPGVGPATAARIVAGRPYATPADLEKVKGIGPVRRRRLARFLEPRPPRPLRPASRPRDGPAPGRPPGSRPASAG